MIRTINDVIFSDIADAIREKNGETTTYKPTEMPDAILAIEGGGGGGDLPEEAFLITGDCQYMFYGDNWTWFVHHYGDKITTQDLTKGQNMFQISSTLERIPFDLNFKAGTKSDMAYIFGSCQALKEIGKIKNLKAGALNGMFTSCYNLRYLPEFENLDTSAIAASSMASVFSSCCSLREVPSSLLKQLINTTTSQYSSVYYSMFSGCYCLDEINGIAVSTKTLTSNLFYATFNNVSRAKNVTFELNEDGTPKTASWRGQTVDLSTYLGYVSSPTSCTKYNSGITADKRVTDDATYAALKTDPDWFTADLNYSRYNHDSAVNTINTLPDTSVYLATTTGTNTIKFKGAAGALTDGGAINTLTEEEIAVATAKGWTVTLA